MPPGEKQGTILAGECQVSIVLPFVGCKFSSLSKITVIWKEQVVLVVGAASSRDHLISGLEAAN